MVVWPCITLYALLWTDFVISRTPPTGYNRMFPWRTWLRENHSRNKSECRTSVLFQELSGSDIKFRLFLQSAADTFQNIYLPLPPWLSVAGVSLWPPHSTLHSGDVQNLQVLQVQCSIDLQFTYTHAVVCLLLLLLLPCPVSHRRRDIFCLRLVETMATDDWAIKERVSVLSSCSSCEEAGSVDCVFVVCSLPAAWWVNCILGYVCDVQGFFLRRRNPLQMREARLRQD